MVNRIKNQRKIIMSSPTSKIMVRERHEILTSDTEFNGKNIKITDTLIGKGSFGHIYEVHVESCPILAAKICNISKIGIPDILESSIMSSIKHPYLNHALFIGASSKKLYIVQERAKGDMSYYTRKSPRNVRPSLDQLRIWCHQLACAVSALHQNHIIHADIKASNVLLYADNNIKLTDFTLSVIKSQVDQKFKLSACTATHRPLECWNYSAKSNSISRENGYWDESVDIWSLGCTFYEFAYGESLFPDQSVQGDPHRRQMYVNAILDWGKYGPVTEGPVSDYRRPLVDQSFFDTNMMSFNDLVCSMLKLDPQDRPSIATVLDHPFFNNMITPEYQITTREKQKIATQEARRVIRYIRTITNDEILCNLAFNIYAQCIQLYEMPEKLKATTCLYIASKLLYTDPINVSISGVPMFRILEAERAISQDLFFRFYPY